MLSRGKKEYELELLRAKEQAEKVQKRKLKKKSPKKSPTKSPKKSPKKKVTWATLYPDHQWGAPECTRNPPLQYLECSWRSSVYKDQWVIAARADVVPASNMYLKKFSADYMDVLFRVEKDVELPFFARVYDRYPN
jgi:hypothetical protein